MPSDSAAGDYFGFAVAAAGDMVVVGAVFNSRNGINTGSAYVFERTNTGQYLQVSKLVASDRAANDVFGHSVAATSTVVIGAHQKASSSGSAYVFERTKTGRYTQVSKLVASDSAPNDHFGIGVAATDGMVVVGAYGDGDESGSVYVFAKNSNGQYQQMSKLVASDGVAGDEFGTVVTATATGMLVIGAPGDDDVGSNSGSAYVFEKNTTGQYQQVSKLMASDGAVDDQLGRAAAVTSGMVVVGAPGSAYVFAKNSTGQYEQVSKLVTNDGAVDDRFGRAVAATDSMVVVGAYGASRTGSAYVFE